MLKKNIILSILLGIFSISLYANEIGSKKLVLLTSLDPDENRPRFRSRSWDINKKLENIFYERLTPYHTNRDNIKIIHFATISDLARELANKENKAVFWVSHSNGSPNNLAFDKNIVVDFQGKDLSEGFQNPSSKLEYLAFVGCYADYLVQRNKEQGYMLNNENLLTYSSQRKVDARRSLKYAIGNYLYHHFEDNLKESNQTCERVERKEVIIHRNIPNQVKENEYITEIKVLQRGHLLGIFPKGKPGERQEIKVNLLPKRSRKDLKLVFDSGITSDQIVMGDIEVLNLDYRVFATRTGRILGQGRYVYNYKGSLDELPKNIETYKKNCID